MSKLRVLDLFSGIGGFSLGLERVKLEGAAINGFETAAFCEIEEFPRKVLAKHWPDVPCYHDVRDLTARVLRDDGISGIDVITGGFPCTDLSNAGKRAGIGDGTRSGLWSEIARLVSELRPRFVIVENVAALLSGPTEQPGGWFGRILGDVAEIGYDAEWHCIRASAVGLPQPRDRVWIIAYPSEERNERLITSEDISEFRQGWEGRPADLQSIANAPFERGNSYPQPLLRRMDDRPANWVDRTGACGNAVVPQIPELIGRAILRSLAEAEHA